MRIPKIVILLLVIAVVTGKKAHRRKSDKKLALKDVQPEKEVLDLLQDDTENEKKRMLLENDLLFDKFDSTKGGYVEDPCAKHRCGPGKQCEIDEQGKAECICIKKCPDADEKRTVCSNHNETWTSDCDLYRMRCLCTVGSESCEQSKYKHVHIDYYGSCKDIGECSSEEMSDFPRRMREWLFNIMQELARRDELRGPALNLEREAEKSHDRKWVNAVIWKFCDLDVHPRDRHVSRHELFPIRAPLMAMERCVAPFLDSCDADDNHKITLHEWGKCLGLHPDEIEDKCAAMNKEKKE